MKNLLTIVACTLAFAGTTFAQHTNVVTSNGNDNDVDVMQTFYGFGFIHDGSEAYVDQVGNNNDVDVTQYNDGWWFSSELAEVNQRGNKNRAIVEQIKSAHEALINSKGDDNYANIRQEWIANEAEIDQDGNRNKATSFANGFINTTYAKQVGNDNQSDQDLGNGDRTADSHLSALQVGNSNKSKQDVEGDSFGPFIFAYRNVGDVIQRGNGNDAKQLMTMFDGDVQLNELYGKQIGNTNMLKQEAAGDGNYSNLTQTGNMNNAVSLQN
ncbi:MAG: hypothetical protein CL946_12065 [Ectothiorhodospiraceae bacterium]|nr:hypothetical protein [Ectothiorhodospiraceae bacterium]